MWQEEEPYYINLWTRKNTIDDKNFIQRIHECLLTHCSRELEELTLLELLDIQGVYLTDLLLEGLGDKEYLLHRISNELNIEFNSRKQYVLKLMSALIMEYSSVSDANNINLFGTNSFNLVWECVCADVFDNKLKVPLSSLPLPQPVKIPNNTQEYLRTLYGEDFETPNTNYNWKENPIYKPGDAELAEVILHKGK